MQSLCSSARQLVLLAALAAVACGPASPSPDGGVSSDGGADTAALATFLADVASRRCEGALACMADEIERSQSLGTAAHCVEAVTAELNNRAITITEAAARGDVRFDARGAEGCLAAIERDACEERVSIPVQAFMWPPECDAVLSGTLAPEAECLIDEQCDGGSCECGLCVALAAEGASCETVACGAGLRCVEGTCAATLHAGDACTQLAPDDIPGTCPANLRCVEGICRTSAELRTAAEGEDCYSPRDYESPLVFCAAGLECHFDRADEPGTCVGAHALDEPCDTGGSHGLCPDGTLCHGPSDDLRCRPYLDEGEECFPSGWGDPCGPGMVCANGDSLCKVLFDNGAACEADGDCESGFCSEGSCAANGDRFCS